VNFVGLTKFVTKAQGQSSDAKVTLARCRSQNLSWSKGQGLTSQVAVESPFCGGTNSQPVRLSSKERWQ